MPRRSPVPPRVRIIDAALTVFGAHGVEATAVQAVADEAGMSKQALLHHFTCEPLPIKIRVSRKVCVVVTDCAIHFAE